MSKAYKFIALSLVMMTILSLFALPAAAISAPSSSEAQKYTVEVEATSGGSVTPATGTYALGEQVTYTFTPLVGNKVAELYINGILASFSGNSYTLTVTGNTVMRVVFKQGVGVKLIQSKGGSISLKESSSSQTSQTVIFTPDNGYVLSTYTLNGVEVTNTQTGVVTYEFTLGSNDVEISATFKKDEMCNIAFTITGDGTVSPAPTNGVYSVRKGESVEFTVTPAPGNEIVSVKASGRPITLTDGKFTISNITTAYNIEVVFAQTVEYAITVNAGANGTVEASTLKASEGEAVTVTVTPAEGYELASALVNGIAATVTDNKIEFVPTSDTTVDITFQQSVKKYRITPLVVGEGGTITAIDYEISGNAVYVPDGESITFVFTPALNFEIESVKIDGGKEVSHTDGKYTFTNVTAPHSISVSFSSSSTPGVTYYSVTQTIGQGGTVTPLGNQRVREGDSLTLTVIPNTGYELDNVKVDGANTSLNGLQYTFSAVAANHTIEIYFKALPTASTEAPVVTGQPTTPTSANTVTVNDVNWTASAIIIDIRTHTAVSKEVIDRIISGASQKAIVFEGDGYTWSFPRGSMFKTVSGNVDFAAKIDTQAAKTLIASAFDAKMAESSLQLEYCFVTTYNKGMIPQGAELKIKLDGKFAGMDMDYLRYTSGEASSNMYFQGVIQSLNAKLAENEKYDKSYIVVGSDGYASLPYDCDEHLILVRKLEASYTLSVEGIIAAGATSSHGSVLPGGLTWVKPGSDYESIRIEGDYGYVIDKIYVDGVLLQDITKEIGHIKVNNEKLDDISKYHGKKLLHLVVTDNSNDHAITVSFVAGVDPDGGETSISGQTDDYGGGSKWTLILAIVIIAVAMIGGGVMFIYKWRQEKDID